MNNFQKLPLQFRFFILFFVIFFRMKCFFVKQVSNEAEIKELSKIFHNENIDHYVWIEDGMSVCLATKPLVKKKIHSYVKHLQLYKIP